MNMYAYAGNDPVNGRDPSGNFRLTKAFTNCYGDCRGGNYFNVSYQSYKAERFRALLNGNATRHTAPVDPKVFGYLAAYRATRNASKITNLSVSKEAKPLVRAQAQAIPAPRSPVGAIIRAIGDAILLAKIESDDFITVYRVWDGYKAQENGRFWTTVDPRTLPDWRDSLAVSPSWNLGSKLSVGRARRKDLIIGVVGPAIDPVTGRTCNGGAPEIDMKYNPGVTIYIIESGLPFEI